MLRKFTRAVCFVAALSLYACSAAQGWPRTYNFSSDDENCAVCVDHRGNVTVVGKVIVDGHGFDWDVVSYNPDGSNRWHFQYNGPGSGDDIPTAIACDWEGNVYVAGVSCNVANEFGAKVAKFTVLKLDVGGNAVWPNTGSYTGFNFYNGAARLNDGNVDGSEASTFNFSDEVCALAVKDGRGSQPMFAITGPTTSFNPGTNTQWRTVVFEANTGTLSPPIKIKQGWPVDRFGDYQNDTPHALAIHSDNTIYVTGGRHTDVALDYAFTTVRYYADGTYTHTTPEIWVDDWGDSKPSAGRSICLDADGNAYVTGAVKVIGAPKGSAIATQKLWRDAQSPNLQYAWRDSYDSGGSASDFDDEGVSISMSDEQPHTHGLFVTVSGYTFDGAATRIATLRYLCDPLIPSPIWVNTYPSTGQSVSVPRQVIATGNGNAYVVGRKDNDQVLLAYRSDGTQRYSPVVAGGTGYDEAWSAALGGAGLPYYAGPKTNADLDFLTSRQVETATGANPYAFTVGIGGSASGTVSNLTSANGSYVSVPSAYGGGSFSPTVQVVFTGTSPFTSPSEMSVTLVGHVGASGLREKVEVYDFNSAAYVSISDQPAPTADTPTVLTLHKNPGAYYVDPNTGDVKIRVTYAGGTLGWSGFFDLVRWDAIGS